MEVKKVHQACLTSCWPHRMLMCSLLWLLSFTMAVTSVEGAAAWSPWFDVEPQRGIDNQSLALIREVFRFDCPYDDILQTQCRKVDAGTFPELYPDGGIFSHTYWYDGVFLRVPCDRLGIVCVDSDQVWAHAQANSREDLVDTTLDTVEESTGRGDLSSSWPILSQRGNPGGPGSGESNGTGREEVGLRKAEDGRLLVCSDYEIRYLCDDRKSEDNTPPPPAFENPLKVNGGFIAMAAGLSVVVPLVCVLIIQLRRAKREEAERRLAEERARGGGSTSDGGESGACDSPPSYEQLFGPDYVPAAPPVLHSRHNSLDMLIEESETGAARRAGSSTSPSPSSSSSSNSSTGGVSPITVAAGTSSSGGGSTAVTSSGGGAALSGGPHNNLTFTGSSLSVLSETDGAAQSSAEVRGHGPDPSLSESEGYVSAPEDSAPVAPSRRRQRQNSDGAASIDTSNTVSLDSGVGIHGSAPPSPTLSSTSSSSNQTPSTAASTATTTANGSTSSRASISSSSISSSPATTRAPRRRAPSSSSDLPPPPDYSPPPPPPPPPLPLTPPPPFTSEAGETSGSGQFRLHAVQRRYPNMHLSIQDFISTLRGQQEQERQRRQLQAQQNLQEQIETYGDTPPPTYEEALRILAKAKERARSAQNNN